MVRTYKVIINAQNKEMAKNIFRKQYSQGTNRKIVSSKLKYNKRTPMNRSLYNAYEFVYKE